MGGFLDPIVTVLNVEFKGVGFGGVSIEAIIRVENPNMGTLDGTNIAYKIRKKSDGTLLAEGDVPRTFKVCQRPTAGRWLDTRIECKHKRDITNT